MMLCLAAGGGCRMCPDPFDYSGPVPNGSSPQNDFRARSTGNRPLLAAPRPWPPVVQAEPGDLPGDADEGATTPSVLVAAGADTAEGGVIPVVREALEQPATELSPAAEPVEPTVLEPVPDPTARTTPASFSGGLPGGQPAAASPVVAEPTLPEAGVRHDAVPVVTESAASPSVLPMAGSSGSASDAWPPSRPSIPWTETPGWRPRR